MNKLVKTKDLFDCDIPHIKDFFDKYTYPWEMLPHIKELIKDLLNKGIPGYKLLKEDVLVGENVSIAETATIIGPAIIGSNTEILVNLKTLFSYIVFKLLIITMLEIVF